MFVNQQTNVFIKRLKIDYDEPVKLNITNVIHLHDVEKKQI